MSDTFVIGIGGGYILMTGREDMTIMSRGGREMSKLHFIKYRWERWKNRTDLRATSEWGA
jgi:hypothetical protein